MSMREKNLHLIEQWAALINSRETEKLMDLFTADAIYEDVPLGMVNRTREERKGLFDATYNAAPDYTMKIVSAVADDARGAAEFVFSGTQSGEFPGYPPTGRKFLVRGAAIVEFSHGRISRWTDFWSLSTFRQQLGFEKAE